MDLVDDVYKVVRQFPTYERFELSQQMRTAAVSIPALIAEARGRWTVPDQRHFYLEARGSTLELETEIEIASRQSFITTEDRDRLFTQTAEVGRLINGLLNSLGPRDKPRGSPDA